MSTKLEEYILQFQKNNNKTYQIKIENNVGIIYSVHFACFKRWLK